MIVPALLIPLAACSSPPTPVSTSASAPFTTQAPASVTRTTQAVAPIDPLADTVPQPLVGAAKPPVPAAVPAPKKPAAVPAAKQPAAAAPKPAAKPVPQPAAKPAPAKPAGSSGGLVVHPGAFCSPAGAVGVTSTGTAMSCKLDSKGKRLRWSKA